METVEEGGEEGVKEEKTHILGNQNDDKKSKRKEKEKEKKDRKQKDKKGSHAVSGASRASPFHELNS